MNEKDLIILEQYDLQVLNARRGRGSFLCETDKGYVQVTEFSGSRERLGFQNRVLRFLKEQGKRADVILENKEGSLVSLDRYENGYVVKEWFPGRECDTKSAEDIREAVRYLARMHQILRLPEWKPQAEVSGQERQQSDEEKQKPLGNMEYAGEPLEEEMQRHTREMKKVRNFIRGRKKKSAFERKFLEVYDLFAEQAEEAQSRLNDANAAALYRQCIRERRVRHGDYSQHNILFDKGSVAAVNYAKCCFDVQAADLYQFFRKIMEKQGWNPKTGMDMLQTYQSIRPLDSAEYENLCIRLAYPEKFWKLANHYFGSSKAWIPEKSLQKLEILVAQEKRRRDFVKFLY